MKIQLRKRDIVAAARARQRQREGNPADLLFVRRYWAMEDCPIARVIRRAFGLKHGEVWVGWHSVDSKTGINHYVATTSEGATFPLPEKVGSFIHEFDHATSEEALAMKGFTFELEVARP